MKIHFYFFAHFTKRTIKFKPVLLGFILCLCNSVFAQPGAIDPTFNSTDVGFGFGDGANNWVQTTTLQPDGKVIIGGWFTSYHGTARNYIARLNADGSLDATFNPGTGANDRVNTIALQPDGKIIIGGDFATYNGTARNRIARLNSDGSLDATFNPGTGANSGVLSTVFQPDGKIIIGGSFTTFNGAATNKIARLNANGSLDATFNIGLGADNNVVTSTLQPDGKIVVGGSFTTYNLTPRRGIARLNADGSLDATFNPGSGTNLSVLTTAFQPDGKIIIGGGFTIYNFTVQNRIARLNADGSLDATFNPGTGANGDVGSAALQPDGKILIVGDFATYNGTARNRIARLNADGSLDANFNTASGANSFVQTAALQPDGKVIIGGWFTGCNGITRNRIARLNADGSLDATFYPGTGANNWVKTTSLRPNGKIIIGGYFTSFNGTARNYLAGLNADGSLDSTFDPGTGANGLAYSNSIQSDGKIIIGGNFTTFNGTARNYITRLNADGSLDPTFNLGAGANNVVATTALQPDGKILIGGDFTTYNGAATNRIARLNADGTLDATFNTGSGANASVSIATLQPDGKIIVSGQFSFYNGTMMRQIARLNSDGSLDATFNPGTGTNSVVKTLALQPDGKILIGGDFTSFNGTVRNYMARLNADGSLDASFNAGMGPNNYVNTIALQPDGKIIIGGNFTAYNGAAQNYMARLNADGSLDATFNPGTGASDEVYVSALQSDGNIIIGGLFTAYNGTGRNRIARILGEVSPLAISNREIHSNALLQPNPNNGRSELVWESPSSQPARLDIFSVTGQTIYSINIMAQPGQNRLPLEVVESGVYLVHLSMEDGSRLVLKMMSSVGE